MSNSPSKDLMNTTQKKGKAARLYIGDDEDHILREIAVATNLSQTMVMSQIMAAGLRACSEAGNRLPLPLKFKIVDAVDSSPHALDQPRTLKQRK